MVLAAEDVAEQVLRLACGNGEDAEAEIDDVDGTPLVELPPMADGGGNRHLARS